MTPAGLLGTVVRGAAAGALGTLAMDLVWYRRYRDGGGDDAFPAWEVTPAVDSWDDAPAPGQMGRKILETATGAPVPVEQAALVSNVMHWSYGAAWTAGFALATRGRARPLLAGPAFGTLVWSSDYVSLPLAGLYDPIWTYDIGTLWQDLSAHLVFGAAADIALRVLERS